MIAAKIQKEEERYIQVWENEKIAIENGRWGPFIRFGKVNVKLPKGSDGKNMTAEEALILTLDEVKNIIKGVVPSAFDKGGAKPKAATKKKAPVKKKASPKKK